MYIEYEINISYDERNNISQMMKNEDKLESLNDLDLFLLFQPTIVAIVRITSIAFFRFKRNAQVV